MDVWIFPGIILVLGTALSVWERYSWAKRNLKGQDTHLLGLALVSSLITAVMIGVFIIPFDGKKSLAIDILHNYLFQSITILILICCQWVLGEVIKRATSKKDAN